jgi:hypothetical protein
MTCGRCEQAGHFAWECPTKTKTVVSSRKKAFLAQVQKCNELEAQNARLTEQATDLIVEKNRALDDRENAMKVAAQAQKAFIDQVQKCNALEEQNTQLRIDLEGFKSIVALLEMADKSVNPNGH